MRAKIFIEELEEMLEKMKKYHKYHNMSSTIYISINDETGEIEFEQASYYPECYGKFFNYARKNLSTEDLNNDPKNKPEIKIGDVLKMIRNIYNHSIQDLADHLNIAPTYLLEIENNQKQPPIELLTKYAEIYDMKLSTLILLTESPEEVQKHSDGKKIICNMMLKLIEFCQKVNN